MISVLARRAAGGGINPRLVAGLIVAVALRVAALPFGSADAYDYLLPWQRHVDAIGAAYLARPFTNYAPLYEHILAALSLFPGEALLRIKASSILLDFLLAGATAACCPAGRRAAGFVLVLLLPTVIMNSAVLAQSDALYAGMLMLALAAALRCRQVGTALGFSAALAAKLQAAFFAPLLGLLWLARRQPLWTVALIPTVYVAAALPMLAAGRGAHETFGVYFRQFGTFRDLSLQAPNLWQVLQPWVDYDAGIAIGLPLAGLAIGGMTYWLWRAGLGNVEPGDPESAEKLLLAAAILLLLVPYVLPKMHERYFYPLDPVLIALVMTKRDYWREAVLAQLASILSYLPFLSQGYQLPSGALSAMSMAAVAAMSAALILLVGRAVRLDLRVAVPRGP